MLLLTDQQIQSVMPMAECIAVMRSAFSSRFHGQMVSHPRAGFRVEQAGLVWTPGGFQDNHTMGLRLYATGVEQDDQLVALWDTRTGSLLCLAVGRLLGQLRTGAIGGVAIDAMARHDSQVIGVIGFGDQGWNQVEAALAVRPIRTVKVYRRDQSVLQQRIVQARQKWSVEVIAAASAKDAVEGADIVIMATSSPSPVIHADWLKPGVHINTLGPKYINRKEFDLDVIEAASIIASDFPEQYRRESEFLLQGTPHLERMTDLSELIQSDFARKPGDITVFLSHGLAGTEVRLLHAIYERARANGVGVQIDLHKPANNLSNQSQK